MSQSSTFLLDADSFIRSKRQHYAFDICPGFWDALLQEFKKGSLHSILPVRAELLRGRDALADWVQKEAPQDFFESIDDVDEEYKQVIAWVDANQKYERAAKQKFAGGADPWLVAFAIAKKCVIVTYEASATTSKALIKLPDVAGHFKIDCIPPYVMLRQLKIKLSFQ